MPSSDSLGEWIKKNVGFILTVLMLSVGGYVSTVRVSDKVDYLNSRVQVIENNGTESIRLAHKRIDVVEKEITNTQSEVKDINHKLDRIDRRVGYILCKSDKKFCLEDK